LDQGNGYSKSRLWIAHLPFTSPRGDTEPIYASGYVCLLVGGGG
jgi:hypothetical protein